LIVLSGIDRENGEFIAGFLNLPLAGLPIPAATS
jgi:hypothetical protein